MSRRLEQGFLRIGVAIVLVLAAFVVSQFVIRGLYTRLAASSFTTRLPLIVLLILLAGAVLAWARFKRSSPPNEPDDSPAPPADPPDESR